MGKTVLITGANRGVGFEEAKLLISNGYKVIIACRDIQKAENACALLGPNSSFVLLDISDNSSITNFMKILPSLGQIDFFVNNAGIFMQDKVYETNYCGTVKLCEELVQFFKFQPYHVSIINTVSISVFMVRKKKINLKNCSALEEYAKSKLDLFNYSIGLNESLKGSNISFFMVHPGVALSPMIKNAYGNFVFNIAKATHIFNSLEKSAANLLYLIDNAESIPSGSVIGPKYLFNSIGKPGINKSFNKLKS